MTGSGDGLYDRRMRKKRLAIFSASSLLCLLASYPLISTASAATASPPTLAELQKITSDDGATDDQFGWSIAVDGDMALVGAPNTTIGTELGQGSVYAFQKMAGTWVQIQS